jgi:hypothetical protein
MRRATLKRWLNIFQQEEQFSMQVQMYPLSVPPSHAVEEAFESPAVDESAPRDAATRRDTAYALVYALLGLGVAAFLTAVALLAGGSI